MPFSFMVLLVSSVCKRGFLLGGCSQRGDHQIGSFVVLHTVFLVLYFSGRVQLTIPYEEGKVHKGDLMGHWMSFKSLPFFLAQNSLLHSFLYH